MYFDDIKHIADIWHQCFHVILLNAIDVTHNIEIFNEFIIVIITANLSYDIHTYHFLIILIILNFTLKFLNILIII